MAKSYGVKVDDYLSLFRTARTAIGEAPPEELYQKTFELARGAFPESPLSLRTVKSVVWGLTDEERVSIGLKPRKIKKIPVASAPNYISPSPQLQRVSPPVDRPGIPFRMSMFSGDPDTCLATPTYSKPAR